MANYSTDWYKTKGPFYYWFLGLIMSDGHLGKDKRVSLSMTDKEVIDAVKLHTGNQNKIYIGKPRALTSGNVRKIPYRISFRGNLHEELIKNGWFYGSKTGKEFIPTDVDTEEKFWHFLRGLLDGDGCLHINKDELLSFRIFSASEVFLNKLTSMINLYTGSDLHSHTTNGIYALSAGHCNSIRICEKMYTNDTGICLSRKKDKYLSCLSRELKVGLPTGVPCLVDGCPELSYSRGLCSHHYYEEYTKEYSRQWNKDHKEERSQQSKERYYSVSAEERRIARHTKYQVNRERVRTYHNEYYRTHPEKMKEIYERKQAKKLAKKQNTGEVVQ